MYVNQIIKYFAKSTIEYKDLFVTALMPKAHDTNRTTAKRLCGLVITLSGEAKFALNGVQYVLDKGTILHAGPQMDIDIRVTSEEPFTYAVIHYQLLEEQFAMVPGHFVIETGENNKLDYLVQQLIHFDKIPGDLVQLKCKSIFMQLVEQMLLCAKMQTTNNVVDMAVAYITENYKNNVSIAEIAEKVGCERRKLAYLFDKQIGLSPIQFLTEMRLKNAKELLRTTRIPVKEVAELVGYFDSFYFCRVFKKQYNITPTQYRHQF